MVHLPAADLPATFIMRRGVYSAVPVVTALWICVRPSSPETFYYYKPYVHNSNQSGNLPDPYIITTQHDEYNTKYYNNNNMCTRVNARWP